VGGQGGFGGCGQFQSITVFGGYPVGSEKNSKAEDIEARKVAKLAENCHIRMQVEIG
jgi:hypothetical protein